MSALRGFLIAILLACGATAHAQPFGPVVPTFGPGSIPGPTATTGGCVSTPCALNSANTATTQSPGDNSTKVSTTAYANAAVGVETARATTAEALLAPLASPTLTGVPLAPTAAVSTNSTQIATTAYADATMSPLFGTGADGDVTISSAITLSRDMNYHNLTISAGGSLKAAGYRIFVSNILDVSAAPALGIINLTYANGGAASGATGGSAGGFGATGRALVGGSAGVAGGTGTTTTCSQASASSNENISNSGLGGVGGAGGAGVSSGTAGGTVGTLGASVNLPTPTTTYIAIGTNAALQPITGGVGGGGGGCGGGDGSNAGGGGGGGAAGAGGLAIYARTIARGTNATAGIISVVGGIGGAGANGVAGTAGGGGGGGGSPGGWVYIVAGSLTGSVIANAVDVSGNTGGAGGNSPLTHTGGTGGTGGASGSAQMIVLSQSGVTTGIVNGGTLSASAYNSTTFNTAGTAGTGPTGVTGGPGGAGATLKVGL